MTFEDRVTALGPLRFSLRQRQFLVTVALHGGFCLRRHYTVFAGVKYGAGVSDFLDRLVSRKLARTLSFRPDRGHVYHVHHSGLYDAIGQADNRNRRHTSAALIARKLMLLDFVLSDAPSTWLAAEADKVAFFRDALGIETINLPQRSYRPARRTGSITTRFFIHKLPVRLAADGRTVVFAFLVIDTTGRALEQFLHDHARLLGRLPRWQVVAIVPRHIQGMPGCLAAWKRFEGALAAAREADDEQARAFVFSLKARVDRNDFASIPMTEITRWHDLKRRCGNVTLDELCERWRSQDGWRREGPQRAACLAAIQEQRGTLRTYDLPLRYDRFGSRPGVS